MKISLAQIEIISGDVTANINHALRYIKEAHQKQHDVVVLPEMFDTGYDMPIIIKQASEWDFGAVPVLREAAKKYNINIVAGVSERLNKDVYNSVVIIDRSGKITGSYRKTHLITAEPMLEHNFLKAGDKLEIVEIDGYKIGIMTCYEVRFPEIGRTLALAGAELLIVTAAWPLVRLPHWQNLIVTRAIENQVFVAASNRLGNDAGIQFAGTSMLIGPYGNALATGTQVHEKLVSAELDFNDIKSVRAQIKVHQDRRESLYNC